MHGRIGFLPPAEESEPYLFIFRFRFRFTHSLTALQPDLKVSMALAKPLRGLGNAQPIVADTCSLVASWWPQQSLVSGCRYVVAVMVTGYLYGVSPSVKVETSIADTYQSKEKSERIETF